MIPTYCIQNFLLIFFNKGLDFGNIYKIELWKFSTFPIFFGQIISAYEGIGTVK